MTHRHFRCALRPAVVKSVGVHCSRGSRLHLPQSVLSVGNPSPSLTCASFQRLHWAHASLLQPSGISIGSSVFLQCSSVGFGHLTQYIIYNTKSVQKLAFTYSNGLFSLDTINCSVAVQDHIRLLPPFSFASESRDDSIG